MLTDKQKKACRKYKITARKSGGDDLYSWAVFENGAVRFNGLGRESVDYYKRLVLNNRT